jgi:hypothetical protein
MIKIERDLRNSVPSFHFHLCFTNEETVTEKGSDLLRVTQCYELNSLCNPPNTNLCVEILTASGSECDYI